MKKFSSREDANIGARHIEEAGFDVFRIEWRGRDNWNAWVIYYEHPFCGDSLEMLSWESLDNLVAQSKMSRVKRYVNNDLD